MPEFSLLESPNGTSLLRREGDQNIVVAGGMNPDEARKALRNLNRGPGFKIGDLFELVAASAFVAAGYLQYRSLPLALTVGGVAFLYFAQCLATREIPKPRLPRLPKLPRPHLITFTNKKWPRRAKKNDPS